MTPDIIIVLLIAGGTFVGLLWERVEPEIVAMLGMGALVGTGILTAEESFSVFGNGAVIAVASMFVLSAALERTGGIEIFAKYLDRVVGNSELWMLLTVLPLVALASAFVNNTPVVVVFLPILISLANKRGILPSRVLIPLSYASIFGGCCTLIGTSTNLLISAASVSQGHSSIGFFEPARIGLVLTGVGLFYLLTLGRWLLPQRESLTSLVDGEGEDSKDYLTEVAVGAESQLIGCRYRDTPLKSLRRVRLMEVIRQGESIGGNLDEHIFELGDRLRVRSVASSLMALKDSNGLELGSEEGLGLEFLESQKAATFECLISPSSELAGKTVRQINFRRRFRVRILAIHRKGANLRADIQNVRLRFGDTLLIDGPQSALAELKSNHDLILLNGGPMQGFRRSKRWIASSVFIAVIGLSAFNVAPLPVAALFGAVLVVAFRCLQPKEAYGAVNWSVIFLIYGMLSLGLALQKTGGAALLAEKMAASLSHTSPTVVLSFVFFASSFFTAFLSNNAVALLLTPISLALADQLGVNPRPLLMAVLVGCSACFATPVGYQTNSLVYGAGGYYFRDFIKVGLPLNLLFWLVAVFVIPLVWPF